MVRTFRVEDYVPNQQIFVQGGSAIALTIFWAMFPLLGPTLN